MVRDLLALGMAGQVAYHLLAQAGTARAPWPVTTIVSCLPVLVLAMGTTLAHMLRADAGSGHGTRGPAADRPPARSHEDQARPSPDQTTSAGTPAKTGPPARTVTVPRQDHRPGPKTNVPGQTETNQARLIASRLAAAGKPVSRRALRSRGIRGSNAALNALAREINAELAGASRAAPGLDGQIPAVDPGRRFRNGLTPPAWAPAERCEPALSAHRPAAAFLRNRDYRRRRPGMPQAAVDENAQAPAGPARPYLAHGHLQARDQALARNRRDAAGTDDP
jgi:hypothetical protein